MHRAMAIEMRNEEARKNDQPLVVGGRWVRFKNPGNDRGQLEKMEKDRMKSMLGGDPNEPPKMEKDSRKSTPSGTPTTAAASAASTSTSTAKPPVQLKKP